MIALILSFILGVHAIAFENAHAALQKLKEESQIVDKYRYEIPSLDSLKDYTFFHEYFNSYKIANDTENIENGFLIEIENVTTIFMDMNELENYGKTDFDLPLGELPQVDHDVFDQVNTNLSSNQLSAYQYLLSQHGDIDSLRILADIHTFGFYDIPVNLNFSQECYLKIIELDNDDMKTKSHANFMLAVFYSTGLFGKVERDVAKGLIHYRLSADDGNIQSQMALAYKYMFGINVSEDADLALYYFSMIKQKVEDYLQDFKTVIPNRESNDPTGKLDLIFAHNFNKFNLRWSDLVDKLYGTEVSQAVDTIRYFETFKDYEQLKRYTISGSFTDDESEDFSLGDDKVLDAYSMLYFGTQKNYNGDYLHARNYKKAFEFANICVSNGILEPEIDSIFKQFLNEQNQKTSTLQSESTFNFQFSLDSSSPLEIFIGRCSQYLGHMYLRGEGTEINYEKAYFYTSLGKKLTSTLSFINDYSLMKYYGLGAEQNVEDAIKIFKSNHEYASSTYYYAISQIEEAAKARAFTDPDLVGPNLLPFLTSSASYTMLGKRKILEWFENGQTDIKNDKIVGYYNSYLKLFDFLIFDFRIPFFGFINSNESNLLTSNNLWASLVGMAIGSELGYENSQSSLGSILYPTIGKFESRKVRESNSHIYTVRRYHEAIEYFKLSALHSNPDSINFLGDLYYNGLYNSTNNNNDPLWDKSWIKYVLPVSYNDDDKIDVSTNNFILSSISILINKVKAMLNYKESIQPSVPLVPRDLSKSISYYRDSSSKGSHLGSFNIGWSYEFGIGVSQDLHLAKRYYDLASTRSNAGYLSVKIAIIRIKLKAILWNLLGYNGRGAKELKLDNKTWRQRITILIGWIYNNE